MMLTVDSITGGNRERDLRTGFAIPFKLTLAGMVQFAIKPMWGINYVTHERFSLPQLDQDIDMGGGLGIVWNGLATDCPQNRPIADIAP
jgi:L-lactate dehydrogenase (cytochrome)